MSWTKAIVDFQDCHEGETAFILCNGPSLRDVDLENLRNYGRVFGTNRIYLKGFEPDYYVCVNPLVIEQFGDEIKAMERPHKFMPEQYEEVMKTEDKTGDRYMHVGDVFGIRTDKRTPSFAQYAGEPLWEGHTVTYVALQIAYWMGFHRVVLVGMDHNYGEIEGSPNQETTSMGPDQWHFDPEYFGKGVKWNLPDLGMSEIAYAFARDQYERSGRRIINASAFTKYHGFETLPLNHVLDRYKTKVSAIVSAYKADRYMRGLMEDLIDQSETSMEIVVVCQEGSLERSIAEGFVDETKKPVKIVTTRDVPTVYRAWNLGIAQASGQFLTNANTDDRHQRHAYRTMANILSGNPSLDLVYHDSVISWENDTWDEWWAKWKGKEITMGREVGEPGMFAWPDYSRYALTQGCFIGPQPMWRANLHQFHGGFSDVMESAGDYEFWLRVSREANFKHVPIPMGLYRGRENGIELSDLTRSMNESQDALQINQAVRSEIRPFGESLLKITIGDEFVFTTREEFLGIVERL